MWEEAGEPQENPMFQSNGPSQTKPLQKSKFAAVRIKIVAL